MSKAISLTSPRKNGFKVKDEESMAKAQIDYIAERVSLLT